VAAAQSARLFPRMMRARTLRANGVILGARRSPRRQIDRAAPVTRKSYYVQVRLLRVISVALAGDPIRPGTRNFPRSA